MSELDYDLVVLGAGSGGISSVNLAKKLGKKVALVEKRKIGGDCTWYGCVPSKALIKAAKVAHEVGRLADYGLSLAEGVGSGSPAAIDASGVLDHVRAVRAEIYEGERPEVFEAAGIDVFIGEPCFVDNHTIAIADKTLAAKHFVIATGSHPFVPPIPGLADIDYLTNETLFERKTLPDCLFVLGGGPIGVEMAAAMSRLGVKVTVLQRGPRILPRDDEELVAILTERLRSEGLEILTGCEATGFTKDGEQVHVTLKDSAGTEHSRDADCVLVAVGRRPNTPGLDLEKAGVDYSDHGIVADEHMRTTAKNIYAVGDVIGSYQFSHIAEYHANIAVPNALLPLPVKRSFDHTNVVWATFTDPELAHAGLTEAEAMEECGDSVLVYRHPYAKVDRARTDLSTEGLSKFVCDSHGKILGIHILGERAADLLHEAQLARFLGVPFDRIHEMVHIYPTYGDAVKRPAVAAYVDRIKSSPLVRIASAFSKSN